MKKGIICYQNQKEIYNGTTTIVEGFSFFKDRFGTELDRKIKDVREALNTVNGQYSNMGFVTKKIARLCDGDEYDKKIGKKVAASKAEIKTSSDAIEYVEDLVAELDVLKGMLLEAIEPTKKRLEELKKQEF